MSPNANDRSAIDMQNARARTAFDVDAVKLNLWG